MFVHLFFKDGCHNLAGLFSFFFQEDPLDVWPPHEFRVLLSYTLNCLGRRMPSDKERNTLIHSCGTRASNFFAASLSKSQPYSILA